MTHREGLFLACGLVVIGLAVACQNVTLWYNHKFHASMLDNALYVTGYMLRDIQLNADQAQVNALFIDELTMLRYRVKVLELLPCFSEGFLTQEPCPNGQD